MKVSGSATAIGRRIGMVAAAALVCGLPMTAMAQGAAPAEGAAPAQGQAAAAAPSPDDQFKFTTGSGGIIWYIKPDKTADFEAVWTAIKAKLSASDNPDFKAMGDNLKIYKVDAPPGPNGVLYLFIADPASTTSSYSPSPFLLFTSKLFTDAEGRELFDKLQGTYNAISPMALKKM